MNGELETLRSPLLLFRMSEVIVSYLKVILPSSRSWQH